jgi:hypothetical protein
MLKYNAIFKINVNCKYIMLNIRVNVYHMVKRVGL